MTNTNEKTKSKPESKAKPKKNPEKGLTTKAERDLADRIGFKGRYLSKLLQEAAKYCQLQGGQCLPDAAFYLREIARQHAVKVKQQWGMSVRQYNLLQKKAKRILRSFSTGYSMGDLRRLVVDGKDFCVDDNRRYYSRSCRFSAKHGEITVQLTLQDLKNIWRIEGVWTVPRNGTAACWLESRGSFGSYQVIVADGHLVGTSHGKTVAECRALEAGKAVRNDTGEVKFLNRFIGFADRRFAGACKAGVRAFCDRHNLNIDFGYRIDFLLSLNDNIAIHYLDCLAKKLQR
jgi:hypothetical protein